MSLFRCSVFKSCAFTFSQISLHFSAKQKAKENNKTKTSFVVCIMNLLNHNLFKHIYLIRINNCKVTPLFNNKSIYLTRVIPIPKQVQI